MKVAAVTLAVLVGILAGFYGGIRVRRQNNPPGSAVVAAVPSGTVVQQARFSDCGGATALPAPAAGRGAASGTVTSVDALSLTLRDPRCNVDVKVTFGSDVLVRKTVPGQAADLQVNASVTVLGQRQSDGSIAAQSITIISAGVPFGGPRPSPSGG